MSGNTYVCPICGTVGKKHTFCEKCQWFLIGTLEAASLAPIPEAELRQVNEILTNYRNGWKKRAFPVADARETESLRTRCAELEQQLARERDIREVAQRGQDMFQEQSKRFAQQLTQVTTQRDVFQKQSIQNIAKLANLQLQLDRANARIAELEKQSPKAAAQPENPAQPIHANQPGFVIQGTILVRYTGRDTKVEVPEGITCISTNAFEGNALAKEIILPSTLVEIGYRAFRGCINLRFINMPNGLKTIGERAFMGCSSLAGLHFPPSVTNIPEEMCRDCTALTRVTIPSTIRRIGRNAFYHTNIAKNTVPQRVNIDMKALSMGAPWSV